MTEAPLTVEQKADFDDIYTAPDPRAYFRTLAPLRYQVPAHAAPLVVIPMDDNRPQNSYAAALEVIQASAL